MTVSSSGTTVTTVEPAATSFGRLFLDRVVATPDTEAFRYPTGSGWAHLSWAATGDRVTRLAAGLLALGLQSEERVAIACSTRVEWVLADFAVMCAGGAVTTVYPSSPARGRRLHRGRLAVAVRRRRGRDAGREAARAPGPARRRREGDRRRRPARRGRRRLGHDVRGPGGPRAAVPGRARRLRWPTRSPRRSRTTWRRSSTPRARPGAPRACSSPTPTGSTRAPPSTRSASCGPTTCSTCGCRSRTRSGRCCSRSSARSASRPPSTGASTRSWTTWATCGRRSWPPCRGSSRRCTAASSRSPRRRAGRA